MSIPPNYTYDQPVYTGGSAPVGKKVNKAIRNATKGPSLCKRFLAAVSRIWERAIHFVQNHLPCMKSRSVEAKITKVTTRENGTEVVADWHLQK